MSDFFKWWYSNDDGNEYMTLLGCSLNDLWVVGITIVLCALIVYNYFKIALESYNQAKNYEESLTKRYLLDKTYVFVFCAISGYGYTILSTFINPYKFRIILLTVLVVWSYRLSKSVKKNKIISRIFEGEKLINKKILDYNLMKMKFVNDEGEGLITKEELLKTDFNTWIDLGNGVKFMRIYKQDKPLFFITEMNPENSPKKIAEFGKQWHDCIEECKVIKGHMIDLIDDKEYLEGETAVYEANQKHKPVSKVFSIFEVEFK